MCVLQMGPALCAVAAAALLAAPTAAFGPLCPAHSALGAQRRQCLASSASTSWARTGQLVSLPGRTLWAKSAAGARLWRLPVHSLRMSASEPTLSVPRETEIKTLLTQRAYQNLIFLLGTLGRDTITANWLEGFQGHDGIRHYHGLYGLHCGGHDFLGKLLTTPNEVVVVEFTRRGNGDPAPASLSDQQRTKICEHMSIALDLH